MKKSTILLSLIVLILLFSSFWLILPLIINERSSSLSTPSPTLYPTSKPSLTPTPTQPPKSFYLKVPFIEQAPEKNWDQPWQDACEEAALLTLHTYYQGLDALPTADQVSQLVDLFKEERKRGWGHDVNLEQLSRIASDFYQYQPQIIDNPTLSKLKELLLSGQPIIVPANGKTLFEENKYFRSGGPYYHFVVISGFDDEKQQFTVQDVGTRHGKNFKYSYSLLMRSIHDLPPSGHKENIEQGTPRVMILIK